MLISKEQHWRSTTTKLEEDKTVRLQGWQENPEVRKKLKRTLTLIYMGRGGGNCPSPGSFFATAQKRLVLDC